MKSRTLNLLTSLFCSSRGPEDRDKITLVGIVLDELLAPPGGHMFCFLLILCSQDCFPVLPSHASLSPNRCLSAQTHFVLRNLKVYTVMLRPPTCSPDSHLFSVCFTGLALS